MWEESPIGTWTLEVINDGRSLVELKQWSLVFLGTETKTFCKMLVNELTHSYQLSIMSIKMHVEI